jgi:hypothetical protein
LEDYFGFEIVVSDQPFFRERTMKFKYPWWSRPFNGFKKYKFVTGKTFNDRKVIVSSMPKMVVMSKRVYEEFCIYQREQDTFRYMNRTRSFNPLSIKNPYAILTPIVC